MEIPSEFILSETDLHELHTVLLDIYKDLDRICTKHHLKLMLSGGSVLGAVRHQGFIPWDDDMDLMLERSEYEKLLDIIETEMQHDYYLYAPRRKNGTMSFAARIVKKNTCMLVDRCANGPFHKGIWIDILPIDYTYTSKFKRFFTGITSDFLRGIAGVSFWYKYAGRSNSSNNTLSKRVRLFLGFLCQFMNPQKIYNIFDKFAAKPRDNQYMTIAAGRNRYVKETLPTKVFFPPSKGVFAGMEVLLPGDSDAYLKNLYGNYMQIPPPEKREKHAVLRFSKDHE